MDLKIKKKLHIITNIEYQYIVYNQIKDLKLHHDINIILETDSKNTLLPFILSAYFSKYINPSGQFLTLHSDQFLEDNYDYYLETIEEAYRYNKSSKEIILFGLETSIIQSEYGYLEKGEYVKGKHYKVINFIEKPNSDDIEKMNPKNFLLNSGMILSYTNDAINKISSLYNIPKKMNFFDIHEQKAYRSAYFKTIFYHNDKIQNLENSVDRGFLEKISNLNVFITFVDMRDLGSFGSIMDRRMTLDENYISIEKDINTINTKNCFVKAIDTNQEIILHNLENINIFLDKNVIYISNNTFQKKSNEDSLLSNILKNRADYYHNKIYHKWGNVHSVISNSYYSISEITIKNREGMYNTVSRYYKKWFIIKGTGQMLIENKIVYLKHNMVVSINVGETYSISNNSKYNNLEILETKLFFYNKECNIEYNP